MRAATFYAVDPRNPDEPEDTIEFTLETYLHAGGDLGRLREDAAAAGDHALIALIDRHSGNKVLGRHDIR